jgi:alpha-beta hydrolase superfamily lysophospholipase
MHASALSVVRPREIDDIRGNAGRRAIIELKERATSLQDYAELADLYTKDNDQLRAVNVDLVNFVDELQVRVAKLEGDREALLAHLRAKELPTQLITGTDDIAPDAGVEDEDSEPAHDEVRFYKKKYSTPES